MGSHSTQSAVCITALTKPGHQQGEKDLTSILIATLGCTRVSIRGVFEASEVTAASVSQPWNHQAELWIHQHKVLGPRPDTPLKVLLTSCHRTVVGLQTRPQFPLLTS